MIVGPINGGMILPELTNPGTAADLYPGKQLIDANGNVLTGSMPTQGAQTITPGTSNKTIQSGRFLTGTQTIQGDPDLKAANIKKGVSIFGVTGTMESATYPSLSNPGSASDIRSGRQFIDESGNIVTGTMPTKSAQTYTPGRYAQTIQSGRYLTGNQTIQGDSNLIASNIRSGVEIFGVEGTYEGDPMPFPYVYFNKDGTMGGTTSNVISFSTSDIAYTATFPDGVTARQFKISAFYIWTDDEVPAGSVRAFLCTQAPTSSSTTSMLNYVLDGAGNGDRYALVWSTSGNDQWGAYFSYTASSARFNLRIALPTSASMPVYNWGSSSIQYNRCLLLYYTG